MPTQADIEHQQRLLTIYRRNLQVLLNQSAFYGGEHATPIGLINSIDESRDNIRRIKAILRTWRAHVNDHVDDDPPNSFTDT